MSKAKTERYVVTPDAVAMLKRMHARAVHSANRGEVPRISSAEVLAVLRATQAERARHAEEVAEARRQKELWRGLAKVTTARAPRRHRPEGDPHPMTAYPVTTPDAVERQYQDSDGNPCDLVTLCRRDPGWAASRLTFERARHAEEVAALRAQLRKVEGERDTLAARMDLPASQLLMVGSELCGDGKIDPNDHRDPRWTPTLQRAAEVMRELTARRAHDEDVRTCLEYCDEDDPTPGGIGGLARELLEWFSGRAA